MAGLAFGDEAARGEIIDQIQGLIGQEGAIAVQGLLKNTNEPAHSMLAIGGSVITMIIGATTVITGPKKDLWLVKTVGVLISVIGASLLFAAYRGEIVPSTILLAVGSAVVLTGVDVIYVTKRIIAPIYVLDAFVELLLIAWWLFVIAKF